MVVDDSIKLAQLEDIKATWDPTNTFHHCQVIASKPVGFYQSLLRKALNSNNNNLVFIASISNPGKKVIFSCTLLFSPMETTTTKNSNQRPMAHSFKYEVLAKFGIVCFGLLIHGDSGLH